MISIKASIYPVIDKSSKDKLRKAIIQEALKDIKKRLNKSKSSIAKELRNRAKVYLLNSPEINSIIDPSGKLRAELGLDQSNIDLSGLLNSIVDSIDISFDNLNTGSFDAYIEVSFKNVKPIEELYNHSFAYIETEKGVKLDWLRWLLEAGNKDVIFGYKIRYGVDVGRTGDAVMIKSKQANWHVPPEFSGTESNNFITRSLKPIEQDLSDVIARLL